jgi:hypothetical protein
MKINLQKKKKKKKKKKRKRLPIPISQVYTNINIKKENPSWPLLISLAVYPIQSPIAQLRELR